ncbi:MAG: nucleotidyltransferase family protein [Candidatus Kerfeldbacteria bacterium]|nr:nucleotidyltransferase family protein [Candidatus Kerfeldbacteria bacterium]
MEKNNGKDRITITLRKDLLPLLDKFVDGERIRNRSHAIEYILGQHLGLGIEQAVIFAGADTAHTVHTLTQIRHRPIIGYIFDMLKNHGIRNIIFVVDEYGTPLREYIGDGKQWGLHVEYVQGPHAEGTGSTLTLVKPLIHQTFLLLYSDVLADINLSDYVEHHRQSEAVGTVALTYKKSPEHYGVARMEGNKIVEYVEKPGEDSKHGLVNAGIYVFEPEIFEYLTSDAVSLEKDVLPQVAKTGYLIGYPFQGKWFDISKNTGLQTAEREWV